MGAAHSMTTPPWDEATEDIVKAVFSKDTTLGMHGKEAEEDQSV